MPASDRWAAVAATLPQRLRAERELPFWRRVAQEWQWGRVADAGCGAGFHLRLMSALGIATVGFDLALPALPLDLRGSVAAGDLAAPPLKNGAFDAVLCLGNTISLLPTRAAQERTLAALAVLLRPGGVLMIQGEDVGALVDRGAVVRTRELEDGRVHLRVFSPAGRRVRMLAGAVEPGRTASLEAVRLLPTAPAALEPMVRRLALTHAPLPVSPPGGPPSWWISVRSGGS